MVQAGQVTRGKVGLRGALGTWGWALGTGHLDLALATWHWDTSSLRPEVVEEKSFLMSAGLGLMGP